MTSGEFCTRQVVGATRNTTVRTAALLMRERHVGTIVVAMARPAAVPRGALCPTGISWARWWRWVWMRKSCRCRPV